MSLTLASTAQNFTSVTVAENRQILLAVGTLDPQIFIIVVFCKRETLDPPSYKTIGSGFQEAVCGPRTSKTNGNGFREAVCAPPP